MVLFFGKYSRNNLIRQLLSGDEDKSRKAAQYIFDVRFYALFPELKYLIPKDFEIKFWGSKASLEVVDDYIREMRPNPALEIVKSVMKRGGKISDTISITEFTWQIQMEAIEALGVIGGGKALSALNALGRDVEYELSKKHLTELENANFKSILAEVDKALAK